MPTEAQWSRLADEAMASTDVAGEISLGPGYPPKDPPPTEPFELVRSSDDGVTWELGGPLPSQFAAVPDGSGRRPPPPYPAWIAAAQGELIVVLVGSDREHHVLRTGWRWVEGGRGQGFSARP